MADFAGKIFDAAQGMIKQQQEGPGFSQGLQEGAALAAKAEEVKMRREEFEHKRQLFDAQKDGMFLKDFKTYQSIKNPKMKKLYGEGMIKRAETRGTPVADEFKSVITSDVLDPNATSQVVSNYFSELEASLAAGRPTEGLIEARAQFADAVYNGNLEAVVGLEAQQMRSDKAAQAQADAAAFRGQKEETRQKERAESRFTQFTNEQNKRVQAAFKDIKQIQTGIKTADSLLRNLQIKLKAGQKLDSAERAKLGVAIEPIVRGIGQAKGPLSDSDVSRILGRYGIAGKIEEFVERFITGEPSEKQIEVFREIIQKGATSIDKSVQERAAQIRKGFATPEFKDRMKEVEELSGLNQFTSPTFGKKETPADRYKRLPPEKQTLMLKQFMEATGLNEKDAKRALGAD